MRAILLPGQGVINKNWIEETQKLFATKFTSAEILYYEHWSTGSEDANLPNEIKRFLEMVNKSDEEYVVLAKSIGTVILLASLSELKLMPKKVVMLGVPYKHAKEQGYDFDKLKDLAKFDVEVYQKEFDPFGALAEIKKIEGGQVKVNKYEGPGEPDNDHHYATVEYLLEIMTQDLL